MFTDIYTGAKLFLDFDQVEAEEICTKDDISFECKIVL